MARPSFWRGGSLAGELTRQAQARDADPWTLHITYANGTEVEMGVIEFGDGWVRGDTMNADGRRQETINLNSVRSFWIEEN